ncbi:MAG: hypothetical protein Ct9H90mP28_5790 [Paracoccaceae bacterium]|nr:MAG: hypothetical protein Ct9H90mP28_5790 [Paracoccaceae bacterium]
MSQQKIKKGKKTLKVFLPEKVAESIHYSFRKKFLKKFKNPIWTRNYFNLCMDLNKLD